MSLDFLNADYSLRKDVEESALYREVTEGSALTALKIPQVDRPAAFFARCICQFASPRSYPFCTRYNHNGI